MAAYLVRRVLLAAATLAGASAVAFLLLHLSGDPAVLLLPPDAPPGAVLSLRHALGFDRPLVTQYVDFAWRALHGDLGTSLRYNEPALRIVFERLPATMSLAGVAIALTAGLAIPLGIWSAWRPRGPVGICVAAVTLLGQAVPGFFLAIFLIYVFAVRLRVLPAAGLTGPQSYVLPSLVLGVYGAAPLLRLVRAAFEAEVAKDYVRTARGKGVAHLAILGRHIARNAAIPILTLLAVQLGVLLGGSVVTETVFAWPGTGRLIVQSIMNRDYPVVQAAVLLTAAIFTVVNLAVDVSYPLFDPRVRLG